VYVADGRGAGPGRATVGLGLGFGLAAAGGGSGAASGAGAGGAGSVTTGSVGGGSCPNADVGENTNAATARRPIREHA
jgi:hypothetical protein